MRLRAAFFLIGLLVASTGSHILFASQPESVLLQQDPIPTVNPFPRPTNFDLIVAEQVFEFGRMFYLRPAGRIWVMHYDDPQDHTEGTWEAYIDEWNEDIPDFDDSIRPPDGLHQPHRGFGLLWRENEDVREALGWGLDPEFGHLTHYTFTAGEITVDDDDNITTQPGVHTLKSGYGGLYIFDEAEGTWELDEESLMEPEATETSEPGD